jgi:aspartokinase
MSFMEGPCKKLSMNVLKFGGTSMGSAESMKQVGSILKKYPVPVAVVVSAMSGPTDQKEMKIIKRSYKKSKIVIWKLRKL